jgi:molybdopterin/thiamine biosynthesis adenylyltransferase
MLSQAELTRYSRHLLLKEIGYKGQIKIKSAKVLIIGIGGLGCPALEYLAAGGVGTIGIVDFDTIDVSNLHRQVLYTDEDVGKPKVEIAFDKIAKLNPFIRLIPYKIQLDEDNASEIIRQYDIIIDGSDNFTTRYLINDTSVNLGKSVVYGSIFGFEAQIAVFNNKGSKNLRALYPTPPNAESVPSCSENGVLNTIAGITGCLLAHETIKVILNKDCLNNQLLIINTLKFSTTIINF